MFNNYRTFVVIENTTNDYDIKLLIQYIVVVNLINRIGCYRNQIPLNFMLYTQVENKFVIKVKKFKIVIIKWYNGFNALEHITFI